MIKKLLFLTVLITSVSCNKNTEVKNVTSKTTEKSEAEISEAEISEEVDRVVDSVVSASNHEELNSSTRSTKIEVVKAKQLIDDATAWMAKGIKKEVSDKVAGEKVKDIMIEFENINAKLNDSQKKEIENYRVLKINESIDLQVKQNQY